MKKLLSILAAVGLTATASTAVVACGSSEKIKADTLNIQTTTKSIWGKDAKGLAQYLTTNDSAKDTLSFVKDTLGIDGLYSKGGKTLLVASSIFKKGITPTIKNGEEMNFDQITKYGDTVDKNGKVTQINQISSADLEKEVEDELYWVDNDSNVSYYVMLHVAANVDAHDASKKSKVVFLKLNFKAPVTTPAKKVVSAAVDKTGVEISFDGFVGANTLIFPDQISLTDSKGEKVDKPFKSVEADETDDTKKIALFSDLTKLNGTYILSIKNFEGSAKITINK